MMRRRKTLIAIPLGGLGFTVKYFAIAERFWSQTIRGL